MQKNKSYIGMLLMLACALLWSLNGLCIKLVPWNAMVLAGWRGLAAAATLFAAMKILRYPIHFNFRSILIGLCVCATGFLYIIANRLTTAANAIVLQYTSPMWLMVLSIVFFKKKYRGLDYGAVLLTIAGIPADICAKDACAMEHHLSPRSIEQLKKLASALENDEAGRLLRRYLR
jgi:drug/metabolite transporter (DMT)-like permease